MLPLLSYNREYEGIILYGESNDVDCSQALLAVFFVAAVILVPKIRVFVVVKLIEYI